MNRFYGLEEKTGTVTTMLCGVQHVLAMFVGIITPPLILAGALDLGATDTAFLVSMALFASGVTTFVQVKRLGPFGSGLLSVQGTSFTFVPMAIQAGQAGGLPLVFGMTLVGAPVEMILSRFIGPARRLFPPVVTGSVVLLIGISLIGVGMVDFAGGAGASDLGSPSNLALGFFVAATILLLNRFGGDFARTSSIAVGLVSGYLVALLFGRVDLAEVSRTGWFIPPSPLKFGLSFDPVYLLPWLIGYFVTTIESIGDLSATSVVSRQPVEGAVFIQRIQGGVLADGLGSLFAGVFNTMPNTTFSQNNGVIRLTGVAARRVGIVVAGILVVLGLFPKMGALIGIMPRPVLGGATVVMFATVALAGLRIVSMSGMTKRSELILAVSLALGLGVTLSPEWVSGLGQLSDRPMLNAVASSVKIVLQSGIAVGAVTATVMNRMLPDS